MTARQSSSPMRDIRLSRVMPALQTTFQRSSPNAASVWLDQRGGLLGVGHVALQRDGVAAGRLDRCDDLVGGVGPGGVVDGHARAGAGQLERDRAADAARAAGDERDASVEIRHGPPPSFCRPSGFDTAMACTERSIRRTRPDSTLPEPISTNCVTPRPHELLDGLREPHRRGQLPDQDLGQVGAVLLDAAS